LKKIFKWILGILAVLIVLVLVASAIFWKDIQEVRGVMIYAGSFEPDVINQNFRSFYEQYPSKIMHHGESAYQLRTALKPLPETYTWEGKQKNLAEWIDRTDTTGLIVIKDGVIAIERYYKGNDQSSRTISWSVAKSVVSFLVGVAMADGKIESLSDPVDRYAPALKGSGYEGVSIKNVLNMSSGVRFNEDYGDLKSDLVQFAIAFLFGSLNDFVTALPNEIEPGTYNRYVSADTQVLAMVLQEATGKSLTDYCVENLWSKIGPEYDAYWNTDATGMEMAPGGLNAALRDYARFGLLYLNQGRNYKGEQLVSAEWVRASVTPDAPHLMPGKNNPGSGWPMGYGYQWWIPENPEGDFAAIGIYGQFIYVHPTYNVVIAKTSAYVDYNNTGDEMEFESMEAFRGIAKGL